MSATELTNSMDDTPRKPGATAAATLAFVALRHGLALLAVVVMASAIWTATYIALILWAVIANTDLGGPLTYPVGLLAVMLAAALASLVLFCPATVLAEWACRRRRLPILVQIPVSVALLAPLCALAAGAFHLLRDPDASFGSFVRLTAWLFAFSLIPIGVYWWVAQTGQLLRSVHRFLSYRSVRADHPQ